MSSRGTLCESGLQLPIPVTQPLLDATPSAEGPSQQQPSSHRPVAPGDSVAPIQQQLPEVDQQQSTRTLDAAPGQPLSSGGAGTSAAQVQLEPLPLTQPFQLPDLLPVPHCSIVTPVPSATAIPPPALAPPLRSRSLHTPQPAASLRLPINSLLGAIKSAVQSEVAEALAKVSLASAKKASTAVSQPPVAQAISSGMTVIAMVTRIHYTCMWVRVLVGCCVCRIRAQS